MKKNTALLILSIISISAGNTNDVLVWRDTIATSNVIADSNYYKWLIYQEELREEKRQQRIDNRIRQIQRDTNQTILNIMLIGLASSVIILLIGNASIKQ